MSANTRKENGNGTIYYDEKEKRWRAEIQWTDNGGKRQKKKFSGKKKTIVKNKLDEFRKQLLISKGDLNNKDITFEEYANNWLTTVLKIKLKPTSYMRKEETLKYQVYPYVGSIPINQITNSDVQNMINKLTEQGFSYSTIKKAYEAVNGCIREYRIKTKISFNPCEGITLPEKIHRDTGDIKFFDEVQRNLIKIEAVRKYRNGVPVYRLGNAIIVLMYTGLRIGELLALTWEDINFDERIISVTKNSVVAKITESEESHYKIINQKSTKTYSGSRFVPISQIAYDALKEIQKINGDKKYVMSTKNDRQVSPRNINRMFHGILTKVGIMSKSDKYGDSQDSYGVHTLRHTFASMLFNNDCDIKVVSELLGHVDVSITQNIYIHLIKEQKIKAIENIDKYSN